MVKMVISLENMGDGLEAKQDFSEYSILKSRGSIILEDENP